MQISFDGEQALKKSAVQKNCSFYYHFQAQIASAIGNLHRVWHPSTL